MKLFSFFLSASTMYYVLPSSSAGLLREKPVLTKLALYNPCTNTKVADLVDGMSIDMGTSADISTPCFNVVANGNGRAVRSVKFGYNNESNVYVDNKAPFAFCGNKGKLYLQCTRLGVGNHTIIATPYSLKDLKGTAGDAISVMFSILADVVPAAPSAPLMPPVNPPMVVSPIVPTPVIAVPNAPAMIAPVVPAPVVAAPVVAAPVVAAPVVSAPVVAVPVVAVPVVAVPVVAAPVAAVPVVAAPMVAVPVVVAPVVAVPAAAAPVLNGPVATSPVGPQPVFTPVTVPPVPGFVPVAASPTGGAPKAVPPVANAPVVASPPLASPVIPEITKDVPDLSTAEIAKVMNWIKLKVTQIKNPFCWKGSYGRGVGTIPTSCPPGKELIGALCYSKCPAGYARYGFDCHQLCPGGFENQGLFCRINEFGRGGGYPWQFGDCLCNDGMLNRCGNDNGGKDNCEMWGAIAYPKCKPGYSPFGCCICRPNVPDCPALGMNPGVDLSCAKKIIIGDPTPYQCSADRQYDAALCYPFCAEGFYGVGPVCWSKCATGLTDCGAACAKDTATCVLAVVDQVLAPLVVAANVVTLGLAAPATGAATITIKTANGATQAVAGTTKLGKAVVKVIDLLQTITPPEFTSLTTRIINSRTGNVVSKTITTVKLGKGVAFAAEEYRQAFADDFAGQTSVAVDAEINRHYHPATANFLKKAWADVQLQELVEANAWETANGVLPLVAIVDITGVTGPVAAYAKPIRKENFPFPCISADLLTKCR